jgi:hypothetical protein
MNKWNVPLVPGSKAISDSSRSICKRQSWVLRTACDCQEIPFITNMDPVYEKDMRD